MEVSINSTSPNCTVKHHILGVYSFGLVSKEKLAEKYFNEA